MAFLKLLFCSSSLLLITALIASSKDRFGCEDSPSFQTEEDVLESYEQNEMNEIIEMNGIYEMNLDFMNIDKGVIFGTSSFYLKIRCDLRYMVLHSLNLNITSVNFYDSYYLHDVPVIEEVVNRTDIVLLDFWNRKICPTCSPMIEVLAYGHYQVIITYTVTLTNNPAVFVTTYTNEENETTWLLATDFYLSSASGLFPYLFANEVYTFKIKVTHLKDYTIFSNVPTSISDAYIHGGMEHIFEIGYISPSHVAIAMVSTKLIRFYSIETKISMYCRDVFRNDIESFKFVNESINDILMYYIHKNVILNTKIDYIILPNYWHDSVHFLGLSFIRESDLIYKAGSDPVIHRYNVLSIISRAIGHSSVDYIIEPYGSCEWLKEGLAILLGAHIIDQVYKSSQTNLLVVQTQHESLHLDTDLIMNPLASKTNNFFDFILRHIKAPFILRMIQQILFENALMDSLRNVYRCNYHPIFYNYWNNIQQSITKESWNTINNFSIKDVIDSWITQSHYPVVNLSRDNLEIVMITADYSENEQNVNENKWYIPIIYTQHDRYDQHINSLIWLTPNQRMHRLSVPIYEWILINLQQTGYYRVYYDEVNWYNIIDYVNSKNYWKIDVLNRAQLIDDLFYFMVRPKNVSPKLFWELVKYLPQEKDYIAWYPMFKALEYLSSILAFKSDDTVSYFKFTMSQVFDSLDTNYIKYRNKNIYGATNDEDTLYTSLKMEAIKWACIFGSPTCLSNATHYLKLYVANSSLLGIKQKHSAEWVAWTFCNGLIEAHQETWNNINESKNSYNDIYEQKRLETALTCSNTPNIILNYWQTAINSDNIEIILSIIVKHANNDVMLTEILKKFQFIQLSVINRIALLCGIINNVYTSRQYEKISEYVQNVLSNVTKTYVKGDDDYIVIFPAFKKKVIENIVEKINARQSQSSRIYEKYIKYVKFAFLMTY